MRSLIWKLAGLVISISIAAYLISQIDLAAFAQIVRSVPIWSLIAALACYLLLNFFRLLRFRILLEGGDIPFNLMYPIVLYHNFLTRILPFKTGELSYIVLLRQHLQRPIREGVSSLVSSRLFELFMVVVVGGGMLLLASNDTLVFAEIALVLVVALLLLVALYFSGTLLHVVSQRLDRLRFALAHMVAQRLDSLATAFDRLRVPGIFRSMLLLSVCTYSMSVSFNLVLLYGLGVDVNLGLLVGIISIVMLTDALPLATFSGLGMIEGGWTFGLVVFAGFTVEQAAPLAFFLHGVQLLAAASTGLLGYLWLQRYNAPVGARRENLG